jgi:Holliday junction DNA helicase RuvB
MIGQDRARTTLVVRTRGAQLRGERPEHVILFGPPGLGKTTLAEIVANETRGKLIRTVGTQLTNLQVLWRVLSDLSRHGRDVLFIDEIHAVPRRVQESLYTALEDGRIEITVGKGEDQSVKSVRLPPFVVVGATTDPGDLEQPFLDRFGIKLSLELYTEGELATILTAAAEKEGFPITEESAAALAKRSRGTPRVALSLLRASQDYAMAMEGRSDIEVSPQHITEALALEDIDELGLRPDDRAVLEVLCKQFKGKPVGVENLAASVGVERRTVSNMIEPWLIKAGLIRRTRRGRCATLKAFEHMGIEPPLTLDDDSTFEGLSWEVRE